jgi:hypothetical protein
VIVVNVDDVNTIGAVESKPEIASERRSGGGVASPRLVTWIAANAWRVVFAAILVTVATCYVTTLTPGHVFLNDDFAAYVMHAKNLVEGHPYSDIRYIPNPDAMWISPVNGYPPVYPLVLAPVYWMFGLDLRAFKVVTIVCFVGFLLLYLELIRGELGRLGSAAALMILAFNPVFWEQRDFILSEFPYLLFSFAALLVIERVYARLERGQVAAENVILVAALLYCAYGTRTIGIALIVALVAADLAKFRRPSRFLLCVVALTGLLIGAQTLALTSPRGYVSAFHFSLHTVAANTLYYGKTLSYVWQNGFSKEIQIVFAVAFTAAAVWGFAKSLWQQRGVKEFYLLAYVAVLLAWNAEIGMRGLLPILPLYFFYGLREWIRFFEAARLPVRVMAVATLVGIAAVSYAGELRYQTSMPAGANVADADAADMFAFVKAHTSAEDVLVFPKPRTMALFTQRRVAALSPGQSEPQSLAFLRTIHATVLIDPAWSATTTVDAITTAGSSEIFRNGEYRVYRLHLPVETDGYGIRETASRN